MGSVYYPLGTEAFLTLECGHSQSKSVCGEFNQHTYVFCVWCKSYERLNTIVATRLGPEQGKNDIIHHLPEIA